MAFKMKVVIASRTGQPRVVDLPEPKSGRNFVTVRVSHSAVILPDELDQLALAAKLVRKGEDGIPLGRSASGTIIDVGSGVRTLKSGIRVAVAGAPYVYHGAQLVVPENLVVELSKKINHEEGSFAGLGATALHLVRTARVQLGETVLVVGADMLGLFAAQMVRAAGATPILVDESDFRLGRIHPLGVTNAFQPGDANLLKTAESLTGGQGVDAALLTRAGDAAGFALATKLIREGGVVVLGARLGGEIPLDAVREKMIEVRSVFGGGPGVGDRDYELHGSGFPRSLVRWTERDNMACFCDLLADRKVQVSPLVTDRIPLERAPTLYEKAGRNRDAVLGVVFTI